MTAIINEKMNLVEIDRAEMEGLTDMMAEGKKPIYLKIDYDDICVYEFQTGMKMNPRVTFNSVIEFAEKEIDAAVTRFGSKDSSTVIAQDAWQIKNGFLTVDICLYCATDYDCSDFVFEDIATHRVSVSMKVRFDARKVYRTESASTEVFKEVAQFYAGLKYALTEEMHESPETL